MFRWSKCLALALVISGLVGQPGSADAADGGRVGGEFIPADAVATIVVDVAKTLASPSAEMYPIEVLDAWATENLGIPMTSVDRVKVVIPVPAPGPPMFGGVVTLREDFDLGRTSDRVINKEASQKIDGLTCYTVAETNDELVIHVKDARTIVVGTTNYIGSLVRAADTTQSKAPLAKLAAVAPHNASATALIAIEPIRPMVMGFIQSQADQIPPPLEEFTKLPELLDALFLQVDIDAAEDGVKLIMIGRDEAAAEKLEEMIVNALNMGRDIAVSQAQAEIEGDGAVENASRAYVERLADKFVAAITPKRDGKRVVISGSVTQGLATQGVLVGLLLPAVQSARDAARRMNSSNNLKQIGLAIHNYHAAYNKMPSTIRDADGEPLLSWRVAILPFIEEQGMWEEFRKDEPWDSEHNIQFLENMPAAYQDPRTPTESGTTVYQSLAGEDYISLGTQQLGFRNITDGTANTIMVVETDGANAVNWSEPVDVELDPEDVLAFAAERESFSALFCDGSVRTITMSIAEDLFLGLMTYAGGEVVQAP